MGPYGLQPISFAEIKAWSELTGTPIRSWEVDWIRTLDIETRSKPKDNDERDGAA